MSTGLVQEWWSWVSATTWQAALLGALLVLLERAFGRRLWPGLLLALWSLVALKFVLPPSLSSPFALRRLWSEGADAITAMPPTDAPTSSLLLGTLALLWLVGALTSLALALFRDQRAARALLATPLVTPRAVAETFARAAARLSLRRTPRLAVVADGESACLVGLLRPTIVLPRGLVDSARGAELEHVLLHELVHAQRRDGWHALFVLVVLSLAWFHPVAWLAARRLGALRELCCDQKVVRALRGDAAGYRATLARQAALLLAPVGARAHGFGGSGSLLLLRLRTLSASRPRSARVRTLAGTLFVTCFAVCCVPLGRATITPALADLRGCLQRRFQVLSELARSEAAAHAEAPQTPEPQTPKPQNPKTP